MDSKISRQKASDNAKISSLIKDIPPNSWILGFNVDVLSAIDGAEVTYNTNNVRTILYHTLFGPPEYATIKEQMYKEEADGFERTTWTEPFNNASLAIDKDHYRTITLNAVESMSTGDSIYLLNGSSFGLQRKIFIGADNAWSCELSGDSYPGFVISPIDQTSFILAAKRDNVIKSPLEETILSKTFEHRPDGLFEVRIETEHRTFKTEGVDFTRVFRCCEQLDHFVYDDERFRLKSKFIDMTD